MQGKDVVKYALASTQNILGMFIADFSDEELLVQPVPGANHLAWQLGHLCGSEPHLLGKHLPAVKYPEIPQAIREQPKGDSSQGFQTKGKYWSLFKEVRQATIAACDGLSDADLDKPNSGELAQFAPYLGGLLILVANHTLMHAGQVSVIRRKLNKPVLF